jgi:Cobalamin-independent synthase, Catalytic domain
MHIMKRSTERFLTTHTGSLPRPDDLVRTMFAKEEGVPVDPAALKARIRSAVAAVVEKQAEAGIDIVNDGEVSKPSYATYVKDRLNGFGGESRPLVYQDLVDFPELAHRVFGDPGRAAQDTGLRQRDQRPRPHGGRNRRRQSESGAPSGQSCGGFSQRRLTRCDLTVLSQFSLSE